MAKKTKFFMIYFGDRKETEFNTFDNLADKEEEQLPFYFNGDEECASEFKLNMNTINIFKYRDPTTYNSTEFPDVHEWLKLKKLNYLFKMDMDFAGIVAKNAKNVVILFRKPDMQKEHYSV
jgi:hypothetical protein